MLLWKLHTLDHRIASIRYRALLPIQALSARGYRSMICRSPAISQLNGADAVIFVKSFALKDLVFAQRASELGVPIVLDLCDNIFVPNYTTKYPMHPAEIIQIMARYAAVITTTGSALASVLEKALEVRVPIMVVSDGIELETISRIGRRMIRRAYLYEALRMFASMTFWKRVTPKIWSKVGARFKQWRVQAVDAGPKSSDDGQRSNVSIQSDLPAPRSVTEGEQTSSRILIWFGHSGGEYGRFGLSDIVEVAPFLEQLARRIRFKLIVVSNDRDAYKKLVELLPIETEYVEWESESIRGLIKRSDVAIVPNSRDPFAICKSANRAVLALSLGVPVVASRTPAMEILEGCVGLDDWVECLFRYLTDPDLVQDHLRKARSVLQREFGADRIATQWQDVLERTKVSATQVERGSVPVSNGTIAVVIHLMQDFDLALPILREAKCWKGIQCQAWVSLSLLEASPRVWKGLREYDVDFRVLDDQSDADLVLMGFRGIGAVLTIAETNQSPHRFPHLIATRANEAGFFTYTMQHGFENIGLTYTDERYPIEQVSFASKTIFTWSHLDLLHPRVPSQTRMKCIPVGCCKIVSTKVEELPLAVEGDRVVGIFENLHWQRYDRRYAERFVQDTQALAEENPGTVFLVKPHHAGRWMTSRYSGSVPSASNLVIADPAHPLWEQFTASQLINSLDGVITTPSTVALDAARAGKPVAVVGYDLDLTAYQPLCILESGTHWSAFLRHLRDETGYRTLTERSTEFVARTMCAGFATHKVLSRIAQDLGIDRGEQEAAPNGTQPADRIQKVA